MTFCYSVNTDNTYIFGQDEADADEKFQECAKELEDVLRKRKSPTLQEFLVVLALSAFPPSGCHTWLEAEAERITTLRRLLCSLLEVLTC